MAVAESIRLSVMGGPGDAVYNAWWHETCEFALADVYPYNPVLTPGLELLRRSRFHGATTYHAVRKWWLDTWGMEPSGCRKGEWLEYEHDAQLLTRNVSWNDREAMNACIPGRVRINISFERNETEVDVTFVSTTLLNLSDQQWPAETKTLYLDLVSPSRVELRLTHRPNEALCAVQ